MQPNKKQLLVEGIPHGRFALEVAKSFRPMLLEIDGSSKIQMNKIKSDPNIPIYMYGPIQMGDALNRNKRRYPWEYLKKECMRYMDEEMKDHQSYGELDHPEESSSPSLKFASHIIVDISFKDKVVYGKVKLLNAYAPSNDVALKARSIILNGGRLGISSRALGSVVERDYYDEVCDDLQMICWDLVSRESTYTANLELVGGNLSESKKFTKKEKEEENKKSKLYLFCDNILTK